MFNTTDSLSRGADGAGQTSPAAVAGGVSVVMPRRGMALPMGELVKALVATMRERRRAMVVFIFGEFFANTSYVI